MLNGVLDRVAHGARNLLINCADCVPGQKLLIVYETEDDGYFDPDLAAAIAKTAKQIGLRTKLYGVPLSRDVIDPDASLLARIEASDCTVFLARLGDQIRFRPKNSETSQIISYALDRDMLASRFGTTDYRAFNKLKALINRGIARASEIHVTCPAGTDFKGRPVGFSETEGDTTLKRFPVSVFAPVPATGFSGRVAQAGFLTGTGSNYYTPWSCEIKETLFVHFEGSRLTRFDGAVSDVARAKAHYEFVGRKYGIDTYFVHSWHAGIHPGLDYREAAGTYFERWSGGAFGNPRLLHFHTCGDYPPGEISLNVLDPTIRFDGVAIWENGRLFPDRLPGGSELLAACPDMWDVFQNPAMHVGQTASGKLTYG